MTISHCVLALSLAGTFLLAGCSATTGPFTQVQRIEPELRRGVATKADVERILGTPRGRGATLLPGVATELEVWSYENVNAKELRAVPRQAGGGPQVIQGDLQHQLLLVIFAGEVLDGFVWYTTDVGSEKKGAR